MNRRMLASVVALCAAVSCLVPAAALAAGIQEGATDLEVNSTKVAFAGHEWWVIGDGASGVYPQEGHATLLGANLDFGSCAFRVGSTSSFSGSTTYSYRVYSDSGRETMWFYNNPEGMAAWSTPNEYAGSTLQQSLQTIASDMPDKERDAIDTRNLTAENDGIKGQDAPSQYLWPLSLGEARTVGYDIASCGSNNIWLTSPYTSRYRDGLSIWDVKSVAGGTWANSVWVDASILPALSLDLSSVLFTSSAGDGGKSAASVGGGFVGAEEPDDTVKYTMLDGSQSLAVAAPAQSGKVLTFCYKASGSGSGSQVRYVSCVLVDDAGQGGVRYYARLADLARPDVFETDPALAA